MEAKKQRIYEPIEEIGHGSKSTVYRAYDLTFDREIALKLFHKELTQETEFRVAFEHEAKIAATLEHNAIVPVYDFGRFDDQYFIAMQLMKGGSLFQRIQRGNMTLSKVASIIRRVASGLDYAHNKKIIHRNLKSRNILFDEDNNAYISNFGLAKSTLTTEDDGEIFGTPAYMSPEQARGDKVDWRTDIYSLGIILYEMLAGIVPFHSDTTFGLLMQQINEPPPPIKGISPDLQAIITRALQKDPRLRYETATDLSRELNELLQIEHIRLNNNYPQCIYNDRAQGEDQLGIKEEVSALAEMLLLRDVIPPIAVGIMGGWGSGKSFVMYLIGKHVENTRAQKVKKGWPEDGTNRKSAIPVYVGHIYQIHFNAWTYAKSNLWASLMDTIFLHLNRQMQLERLLAYREFHPEEPTPSPEKIRESMMAGGNDFKKIYLENIQIDQDEDLKPWRKNLTYWSQQLLKENMLWNIMRGQQVEILDKLKDTEEQLKQLKSRREQFEKDRAINQLTPNSLAAPARHAYFQTLKSIMLAFVSEALNETAKEQLKKQGVNEKDIEASLKGVNGLIGAVTAIVTTFRRNKIYLFWSLAFLLIYFLLPYIWSKYAVNFIHRTTAQLISVLMMLLPVITSVMMWARRIISFNLETKKILEGAYATQQAKYAEEIVNSTAKSLPQKVSELQAEISMGSLAAYDALISLLETQVQEQRQWIGPSAQYTNLMDFVQSRLDAATYENQLGLMHQVRQDIDELTYNLVDAAQPDVFPRGKPRVILYIDDLDRCPPARVTEVLEAIQLLLNTKLFVVVLGIDTRYVTRALEKEYKEILQHEGDPSGLDYLEKIIQIPYRVRPVESENLQDYLHAQMDIEGDTEWIVEQLISSQEAALNDTSADENKSRLDTGRDVPAPQTETQITNIVEVSQDASSKVKPTEETELPPVVIRFQREDLADLTSCCQKVSLTPRSIKRLVNVLKLLKIFWFRRFSAEKDDSTVERDRPRAVKQAVISLLALSSAYPDVMRAAFVELENLYRLGKDQAEVFAVLSTVKLPPGIAREIVWQLQRYKDDIAGLESIFSETQPGFGHITLSDLNYSTFNLIRSFSFVGDPVYWSEVAEDELTTNRRSPLRRITKVNRN